MLEEGPQQSVPKEVIEMRKKIYISRVRQGILEFFGEKDDIDRYIAECKRQGYQVKLER